MNKCLNGWLTALEIDDETIAAIREVRPLLEPEIDRVLDKIYAYIDHDASRRQVFDAAHMNPTTVRAQQKDYWLTYILPARFDDAYLATAQRVGLSHHKVNLPLEVYIGAYRVAERALAEIMVEKVADQAQRSRYIEAINKATQLDMGVSTSTYYELAIDNLQALSADLIASLARAGEIREKTTGAHINRIGHTSQVLALSSGASETWAEHIFFASQLHDVGKIGIPDSILLKPGQLTDDEFNVMKKHTEFGAQVIPSPKTTGVHSEVIDMARSIALTHHERWDGTGYPRGLKGEDIPLEGRITAICDVYDALLSSRPYKKAWSVAEAQDFLLHNKGAMFDPRLIDVFLSIADKIEKIRLENLNE